MMFTTVDITDYKSIEFYNSVVVHKDDNVIKIIIDDIIPNDSFIYGDEQLQFLIGDEGYIVKEFFEVSKLNSVTVIEIII